MISNLITTALSLFVVLGSLGRVQLLQGQDKVEALGYLTYGETREKNLSPGTVHEWKISLEEGQYAALEILQRSLDVWVEMTDPRNIQKGEFYNNSIWGSVVVKLACIADTTGIWTLKIWPWMAVKQGNYEIKWVILRDATKKDRQMAEADSLRTLAGQLYLQSKYDKAELLWRRVLEICEGVLGQNHADLVTSLYSLAFQYRNQARYAEAEPLFRRALEISEKSLPTYHPDVATSLNNLGLLYQEQGKYTKAEPLFSRALKIREKVLGEEHPNVATTLNLLAKLYDQQGKYDGAESLYKRTLEIRKRSLGSNHHYVAKTMTDLATLYWNQGKYDEAESFYKRALNIREQVGGPKKLDLAQTLVGLAKLYEHQGKYDEAEPLFQRGLRIYENAWGTEHSYVAITLNNLAWLYFKQGRFVEAEPLYRRALEIYEKTLGPEHSYVAHSLNNLGMLYQKQGKHLKSEPLFRQALAIWERALGPEHSSVATCLGNLAWFHQSQGDYAEAEKLFERALGINDKALDPDHPNVALSLINLARCLYLDGGKKIEGARPSIERAIRILNKTKGYPDRRVYAYALRAQLRKLKGDSEGALSDLSEALYSAEKLRLFAGDRQETRGSFFEQYIDYYDLMMSWQLEDNQIENAFAYAERARAGVLTQSIQESKAQRFAGIPHSLLQKEKELRRQLTFYDTQIQKTYEISSDRNNVKIKNLQDSYFSAYTRYQGLLKKFAQNYPKYYDLKYQTNTVSIHELQEILEDESILIEYFTGESLNYVFTISKNAFKVTSLPKDSTISNVVETFNKSIKKIDGPSYLTAAFHLYNMLIEPISEQIQSSLTAYYTKFLLKH